MASPLPALSLLETRVLGVLAEKQHTVPDAYPLTLNALVSGCNQKTSRFPVMEVTDAEALQLGVALDSVGSARIVATVSSTMTWTAYEKRVRWARYVMAWSLPSSGPPDCVLGDAIGNATPLGNRLQHSGQSG